MYFTVTGVSCSIWDLELWHTNSWLQHMQSSSLTRDWTWAPCIGSRVSHCTISEVPLSSFKAGDWPTLLLQKRWFCVYRDSRRWAPLGRCSKQLMAQRAAPPTLPGSASPLGPLAARPGGHPLTVGGSFLQVPQRAFGLSVNVNSKHRTKTGFWQFLCCGQ